MPYYLTEQWTAKNVRVSVLVDLLTKFLSQGVEDGREAAVASANEFKMTPLAAAFWNYERTSDMRKTVAELMNAGADPNILLPCKEFSYLQGWAIFGTWISDNVGLEIGYIVMTIQW